LAAARARGIVTLLVTGRLLEDVQRACDELSRFDGGGRRERRKIERDARTRNTRTDREPLPHRSVTTLNRAPQKTD
jgi:hydroxymethylpyrimidine pyrophosphatase-like HAD family hydrolase